jgi:alkylation response protein AidB-like acyl-CoA dehydrogenase
MTRATKPLPMRWLLEHPGIGAVALARNEEGVRKDSRVPPIFGGATEIQKEIIGRKLGL